VSQSLACRSAVLEVFALLFSNRWLAQWQKKRREQKWLTRTGGGRPEPEPARFYARIFSLRVTLWYLIFQRLNFDQTQAAVVVNLREGGADRLGRPRAGKLSRRVRSTHTSAYNQARQRMPLELICEALAHLRQGLLKRVGLAPAPSQRPGPDQRTRQILDGSTLAVLVNPWLAADYPPASNRSGKSDWSLLRIVVGFCARSGAVLSALEGGMQQSEQAMAWTLIEAAADFTIWIGDRNFGIWRVAAQAVRCHQDTLTRLTRARATKLTGGQPIMWGAGQRLEEGIKALSFSQARRVLLERFEAWGRGVIGLDDWSRRLLEEVAQHTLPKRSKERPGEVRRARHKRLKYPPLLGSRAAARMRDQATESL
jgi:hypothetical protein